MWGWKVPKELHECDDSRPVVRAKCFLAYTGSNGEIHDLVFETIDLDGINVQGQWMSDTKWEDIRWDRETAGGASQPRDMLFGFQLLSQTPMFRKGGLTASLERLAQRELTSFGALKRLKGPDAVNQGMWIAVVRVPRASGARNPMPYNRRKDVLNLQVDIELGERSEKAMERLGAIRKTIEGDIHPADSELRTLPNGTLFAKPLKFVTCSKCGAQGHHTAISHDDVYAPTEECYTHEPIAWLQAPALEEERLALPTTKEGKGVEYSLRNVTTHIPLRTARALKLMGMDIEGDIPACGVEQVQKQRHYKPAACIHGKVGCCCCIALTMPYLSSCNHGKNSFCCCCATVKSVVESKHLETMLHSMC